MNDQAVVCCSSFVISYQNIDEMTYRKNTAYALKAWKSLAWLKHKVRQKDLKNRRTFDNGRLRERRRKWAIKGWIMMLECEVRGKREWLDLSRAAQVLVLRQQPCQFGWIPIDDEERRGHHVRNLEESFGTGKKAYSRVSINHHPHILDADPQKSFLGSITLPYIFKNTDLGSGEHESSRTPQGFIRFQSLLRSTDHGRQG